VCTRTCPSRREIESRKRTDHLSSSIQMADTIGFDVSSSTLTTRVQSVPRLPEYSQYPEYPEYPEPDFPLHSLDLRAVIPPKLLPAAAEPEAAQRSGCFSHSGRMPTPDLPTGGLLHTYQCGRRCGGCTTRQSRPTRGRTTR
jgi:hypothetical protein